MEFLDKLSSNECTISICIPAYNNSDSLSVALESICLQNYSNLEILISDDHSPNSVKPVFDQWASMYPNFLWRYCYQETNLGVVQNQVWLLNNASGHLMTFFQHDDYLIDPDFYVAVAGHYMKNQSTKLYLANAHIDSPLQNEPINKKWLPLDGRYGEFKRYKPQKFLKHLIPLGYGSKLPISWSSVVFECDAAKLVEAFSNRYLLDKKQGVALNAFVDEEGGIFLSLLNDRYPLAFTKNAVSFRSILETSFSLPQNNPGALLVKANNPEVFSLLLASKMTVNVTTRIRMIANAILIGLNTDNNNVRRFLGNSYKAQLIMLLCIASGKIISTLVSPLLKLKTRAMRFVYLILRHPRYLISKLYRTIFPNQIKQSRNLSKE